MEMHINTRIFKMIVLMLCLTAMSVEANPLLHQARDAKPEQNELPVAESKKDEALDRYDQRQNGTENYRVKVDGLVFIMAPADSLLLAGAALEPNFTSLLSEADKPRPKPEKDLFFKTKYEKESTKVAENEPSTHAGHKPLRITSLIAPLLSRLRHAQHQQQSIKK